MSNSKHIFLCGFMGCGKSTHGKKLAAILKQPFIDLDTYIQKQENKTVQFIFDNEGEELFRELETKYLNELIALKEPHVISLGGGTVCFNGNIEKIKAKGILIYIEMSAAALAERLKKSNQKRPLLKNVSPDNLIEFIEKKLKERNQFYTQAHITLKGISLNHIQLLQWIQEYNTQKNA